MHDAARAARDAAENLGAVVYACAQPCFSPSFSVCKSPADPRLTFRCCRRLWPEAHPGKIPLPGFQGLRWWVVWPCTFCLPVRSDRQTHAWRLYPCLYLSLSLPVTDSFVVPSNPSPKFPPIHNLYFLPSLPMPLELNVAPGSERIIKHKNNWWLRNYEDDLWGMTTCGFTLMGFIFSHHFIFSRTLSHFVFLSPLSLCLSPPSLCLSFSLMHSKLRKLCFCPFAFWLHVLKIKQTLVGSRDLSQHFIRMSDRAGNRK